MIGEFKMSINLKKIERLNKLLSLHIRRKHIIVLNPVGKARKKEVLANRIVYDAKEWELSEGIKDYVEELSKDTIHSDEEKILLIYQKVCEEYVYDDNLISYIKKIDDDMYDLPEWYGRDVDSNWDKNRERHNRRVCFELSRLVAKSLIDLLPDDKYNICIFWDKNLIHYFVGLTCEEYSLALDLDNFFNIKDLTRLKTELTAEGITVLEDKNGKFSKVLAEFNHGRNKNSIENIESRANSGENDDICFLRNALNILIEDYDIDSQGIFEYMKEVVDIKLGPEARTKIWKKINGKDGEVTRYIRCLTINIGNQTFLIDGDEGIFRQFDEDEFEMDDTFIPFRALVHDEEERYDGT